MIKQGNSFSKETLPYYEEFKAGPSSNKDHRETNSRYRKFSKSYHVLHAQWEGWEYDSLEFLFFLREAKHSEISIDEDSDVLLANGREQLIRWRVRTN